MTDRLDDPNGARPSVAPPVAMLTAPPPALPELPDGVEPGERRPAWKPWSGFVALVLGFLTASFGYLVIAGIGTAFGSEFSDPSPGVTIGATYLQDALLVGFAVAFAATVARPRPWQFGLRPTRFWPAVGWTALTFVVFLVLSQIWVSLMDLHNEKETLPTELGVDDSTAALIGVAILVTVIAPIAEELFFRGFFFRALANWKGIWPAAVVTGITFGGIHAGGSPVGFLVPLGILGFLLCLLYVRTKSLYPSMTLHAVNNSLAFGSTQHWDWQIPILLVGSLSIIALCAATVRRVFGPAPERPSPV